MAERTLIVSCVATSLILLSGGLDSATALAAATRDGASPSGLFIMYGQAAERAERQAAAAIADYYSVSLETLTVTGRRFGEGEIRGRNAFLIHGALLAAEPGPTTMILGIHAGTGYVDCTPEFVGLMQRSLAFHTGGEVTLAAPFVDFSKGDVYALARKLHVPVELTYSCERGGEPCGECLSCRDRELLSAFT
ncbi:MAG TPA: 7-cyano-7-deazaguanine synthase [Gaiellaceae bacterium]